MAAVINQLFEEAIQRATELAARAETAGASTAEIQQAAESRAKLAEAESGRLHSEMAAVVEALSHAGEEVRARSDRTCAALDGMPVREDAVESVLRNLVAESARTRPSSAPRVPTSCVTSKPFARRSTESSAIWLHTCNPYADHQAIPHR